MASDAAAGPERADGGHVGGPWIEARPGGLNAARALLAGMGLIMMGNGLQGAVLGVRTEHEGFGLAVGGMVMASYYLGFLVGTKVTEYQLGAVGHIRVFAALASLASTASILHLIWVDPVAWAVLRLVSGVCVAGVLVTVESWLNDMATNANRGRILSMYMVVTMGGLSAGQFLLNAADPAGFRLFVVASVLVSLALLPVTLSATSSPPLSVPVPASFSEVFSAVPIGVVTAFWAGMAHGAFLGLGAIYAAAEGLSTARISLFVAVPTFGAIVLQWPAGWLSDRIPRRIVIFAVAVAAAALAAVMLLISPGSVSGFVVLFLFGGTTYPLYSLAMAHAADWMPHEKFNGASAVMVRCVGVGAVLGPVVGGALMSATQTASFFVLLAAVHGAIALYVGWRLASRAAMPLSQQGRFAPWPARASAMAAHLLRHPRRA